MSNYIQVLKSKIHRAVVTEANLEYFGSITICETLMKAANLKQFEKVLITNMRNGERLETYVLKGKPNSGHICMNGPSAFQVSTGDEILIMAFSSVEPEKAEDLKPLVVFPSNQNKTFESVEYDTNAIIEHN